ncbi:hypothetical protein RD110_03250 [Rhodoferax koreense]|uniref:HTH gntR-type domain-containing protein n=1 Tax=Rhodoferax koreensis TaxID=1842727 RepID=A0A1P8JRG7_9BURK|nr:MULTISPECIES: GntR family transcriptional regulator [Comamonadaceae]APW36346.1 hypothetical protein RD110_03250 [Rhodoferax koreense]MDM0091514.1 GntR family transcriptional regulator [Variovorax sp. J22G40]MDM0148717.1 GntR family transcriptional regulator [Variovorax sp. J2P1-31]
MSVAQVRPIFKLSAEAQVEANLRDFILSGAVKPGSRVTEIALSEQLGVARATLRTGLHKLASEGILVQIPYTGWQIAELSAQDVWEVWTLRGSLEGLAARLAAQCRNEKLRTKITQAYLRLDAACKAGRMDAISKCDFAFHRAIIEAAQHSRLDHQYRLVEQQVRLCIDTSNRIEEITPEAIRLQHKPIYEAIQAGKPALAAEEAMAHNESEGKRLEEWLKAAAGTR